MKWACLHLLVLAQSAVLARELSVTQRIEQRAFPSVFQAWNGAPATPGHDADAMLAKHDLVFLHPSALGLVESEKSEGLSCSFTRTSLISAQNRRTRLLALNSHLVLLAEVRYRDAPKGFLPEDSPWWKRDDQGQFVLGWAEGGYRLLDVASTNWQTQVAQRAQALMATRVFDGIMLDWWNDDGARLSLVQRVREAIGSDALILVNANDHEIPRTASYVNGLYMECYRSGSPGDWKRISQTLCWAESNLRAPRVNCVETWFQQSRADLSLMRAVTTLTLTQSDGYCLFADPNDLPTPDHRHDWYPFWDRDLGRPTARGRERSDGAWERTFVGGTAVYNPGENQKITARFPSPQRSRATGRIATEHPIAPNDGDIFLHE